MDSKCLKIETGQPPSKMLNMAGIVDMFLGFQKSQVLYVATSLGIFDELNNAASPLCSQAVSNRLHLDPDGTNRLMNTCVGLGLLETETNAKDQVVFKNSHVVDLCLVKSSPMCIRPVISKVCDFYPMWGSLLDRVRDGAKHTESAFCNGGNFNDEVQPGVKNGQNGHCTCDNNMKQLEFLQAMHFFSRMDAPAVTKAFDLSMFQSACDLGGGTGALAVQLAQAHPHLEVTVLDLPHVVNVAPHFLPENCPRNVTFQAGDFFKEDLPSVDLFILSHVIHDWSSEKVDLLLEKAYQSLPKGGAILICEKVLNDDKRGPIMTLMFDLGMLVCNEGRERSAQEYTALLSKHGFNNIQVEILNNAPYHDAILARKF